MTKKGHFVDGESFKNDELDLSNQDDEVPTKTALANLSDNQVNQMYLLPFPYESSLPLPFILVLHTHNPEEGMCKAYDDICIFNLPLFCYKYACFFESSAHFRTTA